MQMEIEKSELETETQQILDSKYILKKEIGSGGYAHVYLVEDINTKEKYAAKVLDKEDSSLNSRTDLMKQISNPNVIKLISTGTGPIVSTNCEKESEEKNQQYVILEYASKGDLFDYICVPKKGLDEKLAKVMFWKIISGIKALHDAGICHRDIKMENIILNENFEPKITDFGFATELKGKDDSGFLSSPKGTNYYAAPEVMMRRKYEGKKTDIFALGATLFTLVTCKTGFCSALPNDRAYRLISTRKYEAYWKIFEKCNLSKEFKNLFVKMVAYNPAARPSIEEILEDDWFREIRELNEEQRKEIENDLVKEFEEREIIVRGNKR